MSRPGASVRAQLERVTSPFRPLVLAVTSIVRVTESVPSVASRRASPVRITAEPPPAKPAVPLAFTKAPKARLRPTVTVRPPPPSLPLRSMVPAIVPSRPTKTSMSPPPPLESLRITGGPWTSMMLSTSMLPSSGVMRPITLSLLSRMTLPPPPSGLPPIERSAPVTVSLPKQASEISPPS